MEMLSTEQTHKSYESVGELKDSYTSTGVKLFAHQEAMSRLRNKQGTPISAWCAPTDVCNARCSFCSVGERPGDVLPWAAVKGFVDQLVALGLKSITFSGGGNFLMYRCKETGTTCSDVIRYVKGLGVECALITNGMPMVEYPCGRTSWKNMPPDVLDMLTWCRISMAGLDHNHKEQQVYVPDFNPEITSLGFSWIMADSFEEPSHKHGWVSTPQDVRTPMGSRKVILATERLPWIEEQIRGYVERHKPAYVRLLCDCLRPDLIPERHKILSDMASRINPDVVFSQSKPPRQPDHPCAKVYTRPCLNADGWVYPCDSVVLNKSANHQFGSVWRVCRWDEVGELFSKPIRQVIPNDACPGCVFADAVDLIGEIIEGRETPAPTGPPIQHVNYI
jgi:MoaA/NifB/PqqE/SkfB family radical SAM enzyme